MFRFNNKDLKSPNIKFMMEGTTLPELEIALSNVPDNTNISIDRCASVPSILIDDNEENISNLKMIDAVFRDFPSGKVLGKFIARISKEEELKPSAIGSMTIFPVFESRGMAGVGYGDTATMAIFAAVIDYHRPKGV